MDATVKKQSLLRKLQMPGANRERVIDAIDSSEIQERGMDPEWDEERKKRLDKKNKKKTLEFVPAMDSVQILGSN